MIRTDEADYKYWINFDKNIPSTMRFKEYHVVDDILYWVTQEPFDELDLRHFIDALENTYLKKAYIVVRDVSSYDLKKDMAKQVGVMVDLTDDISIVWGKNAMTESTRNESKKISEHVPLDVVSPEILKPGFTGAVVIECDIGSKFYKVVMYPVSNNEFRICDYDRFNPRMRNARDIKIEAETIMDGLEIVQKYWGEIIRVKPLGPLGWKENMESIKIEKECKIPGTDVILEKGDKIELSLKKTESNSIAETIFEDSNFEFVTYMNTDAYDYTYRAYRVYTKRNSKAYEFVVEIRIDNRWKTWEPEGVQVAYGLPGTRKSITEFIKVLQDSLKFADKVAAYLKVKVINR